MIGDGNPLYDIKPRRRYGFGTQRTKEREERRSCFFRFLFPGNRTVGDNRIAGARRSGWPADLAERRRDRTMQTTQRMQIMRTKQKQNMRNSGADAPGGKISGRNGKRTDAVSMRLSVSVADKGRRQAGRKGNEASKRRWRGKRSKGRKNEEAREDEADGASDDQ